MSRRTAAELLCFGASAVFVLALAASLQGQQPSVPAAPSAAQAAQPAQTDKFADDFEVLDTFLPGDNDPRDEDAKLTVMINCTVCHGPKDTKERLSLRAGGDIVFWTGLVRKMNTSWNARIQEEDVTSIAAYLAKYLGPPSKKTVSAPNEKKR